jgi:hypothetical protein
MFRAGLGVAAFVLVSSVASAQTITTAPTKQFSSDVVVLKDGTVLHGTVGEMVPNQSLTITIDGQPRKIEWKDIERVDIDRAKAAAPPAQQAVARTMVHVEGVGADAYVQMLDEHGTSSWFEVCEGSCNQELRSDGLYRINGAGIRASQPFRIAGPRADLQAKTASSAGFVVGLSLLVFGGLSFVNGISFFLVGTLYKNDNLISSNTYRDFMIAGGVLTGVGVAALVSGGLLLRGNVRTSVAGATTVRVPAWRDAPQLPSRAVALSFPLLAGSF